MDFGEVSRFVRDQQPAVMYVFFIFDVVDHLG
jgi:hypothetical protein